MIGYSSSNLQIEGWQPS